MTRRDFGEQFRRPPEQARGRTEALAVDAMVRFAVMVLQMDEAAGELDECFVKDKVLAFGIEPDVLKNVVRGVVVLRVEKPEVFEITRMPR